MNLTRVAYTLTMVLTYPLELVVVRHSVLALGSCTSRLSTPRHVGVTTAVVCASLACALATDDVGFVVELTGGCCASVLGFVLPAALFLRVNDVPLRFWEVGWSLRRVLPVLLILGFGLTVFVATTWQALSGSKEE